MNTLWQDLRYGLRMLIKNPGFTAVAVLTLAIGIGSTTTVFDWIDSVLLRPLPGTENPSQLASFETVTPNGEFVTTSYPDYRDYRDHLTLLSGLAMAHPLALSVGDADHAERVWGELVSGNYFAVLGVKPILGRVFLPEEYGDKPGAFPIAVISSRLWRSSFDSDPAIIGKTVRVNRYPLTVVGVVPGDFRGTLAGLSFNMWVPYMMQPQLEGVGEWMLRDRQTRNLIGTARLKPGVTLDQARAEIAELARYLAKADADTNKGISATLVPLWKSHFGAQGLLLAPLEILMGVCLVVLLIVCANVANLLLARFTSRQKEFSVRLALGAGHGRLARQIFTESLLLAAGGTLAGVVMASFMRQALHVLIPPGHLPLAMESSASGHVLAFTILLCVGTALLSGLAPALQSVRPDVNESLKEGGRGGSSSVHTHRLRNLLVVSEVSLALVALIGAGLFVRGFQAAQKISPGFDPDQVVLSQFYLQTSAYNLEQRKLFCYRLRERLEAQPGVTDVAYSDGVPLGFEPSWWEDLQIEGYVPGPSENMKIFRNVVAPGYFRLLRIPLLEGRDFTEKDDEKSQKVMIVNQTFVHRFFRDENPLGRRVHGWGEWFTVVGEVKDSKYHYLTEAPLPYFYVPFRQVYRADMALGFYVRTAGSLTDAMAAVRREVRGIDPNVAVFDTTPLADYIGASLYPQKIAASLLSALGLIAMLLAAVGLYSVMAFSVARRTHEIGIRMALGARPFDALGLVVRKGMAMTLAGLVVGLALALAASRALAGLSVTGSAMGSGGALLRADATDPLIYLGAALFLTAIALLASYLPARRATKVEPTVALRYE
jgi:putative ABC transport system permease protein